MPRRRLPQAGAPFDTNPHRSGWEPPAAFFAAVLAEGLCQELDWYVIFAASTVAMQCRWLDALCECAGGLALKSDSTANAYLSRLGSAPVESHAVREFMQHRLCLFADCCVWMTAVTWGLNAGLNALFFSEFAAGRLWSPRSRVHAAMAVFWALLAWVLRHKPLHARLVALTDLLSTFAMALGLAAMVWLGDVRLRSDMVMAMAIGHLLVLRAAIVPSTGLRTAATGALAELPIVLAAYLLHAKIQPESGRPSPASVVAALVVWALMAISTTTVISSVIYGLSQRLRATARLGQYTLEDKLGEGGMGVVYRARHALLRRPTAVKLLSSSNATHTQISRFEREVQSTAAISHPNIVAIYDYGRSAAGVFYYVMEYVDGIDLERIIANDGPQPEARVREILIQAADALAEAHAAGLVHRDVKPSNMILTPGTRNSEQLKLVDFGLVKDVNVDGTQASGVFDIKGTPLYMAPEMISGATEVDARTDLYALGAVGYYLLTGLPVFEAASIVEICACHLYSKVVPPTARAGVTVAPQLEDTLLACLAKSPAERPTSALALLDRLRACQASGEFGREASERWWRERAPTLRALMPSSARELPTPEKRLRIDPLGRS